MKIENMKRMCRLQRKNRERKKHNQQRKRKTRKKKRKKKEEEKKQCPKSYIYIYYRTYNIASYFARARRLASCTSGYRNVYHFFAPRAFDNTIASSKVSA